MKQQASKLGSGNINTVERVEQYIKRWLKQGYREIPDEVPTQLMRERLAPSYKAICQALLSNDMHLVSLGCSGPRSDWYSVFKKIEIEQRPKNKAVRQLYFNWKE